MIKTVILDLDGTLADTITDIRDGLNGMLGQLGFPQVSKSDTLANINNGAFELVRRSLPEKYRTDDDFVKIAKVIYEKYYAECYNTQTAEYVGITEALKSLSDSKITLSVLSNKQDEFVKKIVAKLFPDIPFAFVMGQSDRFPTKPDPTSILYILDSLGASRCEAALVGDSNIDMLTARNAEIIPIGVAWGYRSKEILLENGAKYIVSSPCELTKITNLFK